MQTMDPIKRNSADRTRISSRGKWKRRFLALVLLFVTLIVLSPILIAKTPLRNWLLARAVPQLQGGIHLGGASLWWFSAPVLTDLEVRDVEGRMLLSIPRLEAGKSLLKLLCRHDDLGEIRLTRPAIHLVCTSDSSNLETTFSYWLRKKEVPPDSGFPLEGMGLRAVVTQGRLLVEDEDGGRKWSLDPLDATVELARDRRNPSRLELNAAATDGRHTGRVSADVSAHVAEMSGAPPRPRAEGALHAEDLPLDALEPFLRRLEPRLKLGGWLNADLKLQQGEGQNGSPDVRLSGNVAVQELSASDSLLGADILRLPRVEMPCRIALEGSRLSLEQLQIQSEVGKIGVAGAIDLSKDAREGILQAGQSIEAELNLARLADLLPNALHLTKDTRLQSGTLTLHLRSSLRGESLLWEGDVHTSDLEGQYQGQRIVWKEPFALTLTGHQDISDPFPVLERFRCDSDFLRFEMSGSLEEWTARGNFNLGRLSEHLAGFVELGSLRVSGEGTVRAEMRRHSRACSRLESDLRFARFRLTDGTRTWGEDGVTVRLDLIGALSGGGLLQAGGLHVHTGADGIDLDLLEPIASVSSFRAARARLRLHGDLARWRGRVCSLTGFLESTTLAGQFELDSRLRYEPEAIQLEDVKVTGRDVRLRGFGLTVDEPSLDFTTSGRWLPPRDAWELQHTRLSCSTVTLQAPTATLSADPAGAWQITACADVQGDLARMCRCLRNPPQTPDTLGGALAGRLDLRPDDGRQIAQVDVTVQNLVIGSSEPPIWHESRVNLSGQAVYDVLKDAVKIGQLHLDCPTLTCDASGEVGALSGDMELSLDGKLGLDLEKLEPRLRPYLGPGVKLSGREVRPFHVAGALAATAPPQSSLLARLHGDVALAWQTLQAVGCQIGPADLHGQLSGGSFHAAPIEATLNRGRLRVQPTLRLHPAPLEVTLTKGRVVEHARLSPSACASALGYAVPVLAGVVQADGEISLDLQSGSVPLTDPAKADLVGWFTLHSAQVSGSPLVQELSVLLKGPATLTLAKDNIVPFRLLNGRVYHTGLELRFPELIIRTSGSVGLDGSLALTAEMPVPPKWLGNSKLAKSAAANQTIRLPIGGTLDKPKIDEQALRNALSRFARDAAGNVLRQELDGKLKKETEGSLKKLFRSRK
jgi:translocation and assembly module TamB